ncbi:protein of unknown function [Cupriavidus neocaledonicus]|uniref:Uncharacterized protein n=1 Tax=Cupriavidus neocaledonicus TaxID=1040979 RepID=A0A375H437_9BURK|nr:protein of unknown function [Cupriavidus neocaledonicus]
MACHAARNLEKYLSVSALVCTFRAVLPLSLPAAVSVRWLAGQLQRHATANNNNPRCLPPSCWSRTSA